jgi:hypothetical protein
LFAGYSSPYIVRVASSLFLLQSFSLQSNLGCFRTVIWLSNFIEPRMIQGLLGSDAAGRVIYKNLLKQIEEVLKELVVGWNDVL